MTTAKRLFPTGPGEFTKAVLLGQESLVTGEYVIEACATDIHKAYVEHVKRENQLREKLKQLKGMTWLSFVTMFRFMRYLGLIELVREEPMRTGTGTELFRLTKNHEITATPSKRRIYRLTDIGAEDERCWTNITRAYKESWVPPLKIE